MWEAKILRNIFRDSLRRLGVSRTIPPKHVPHEPLQDDTDHLKPLRLLAEQGDWIKLEEAGRELLLQNPPQYEAIELVAYSLQQGGCLEATTVIAEKATQLFPTSWMFHFLAGVALKGTGREKDACKYLRQAVAIRPNDSQSIRQWIEAIAASQSIELAASEYAEHCRLIGRQVSIVVAPISTVRDWAQKTQLSLLEAGEVEEIPFRDPRVFGNPPTSKIVYALSNKPYVADVKDVRIFSNSSLILTSDGTVLSDTGGHPKFGRIINFAYETVVLAQKPGKLLLNLSEFISREIEGGIFLSGLATSAFGHWLPEFLPKLQFLQQHPDFGNLPIIVDAGMPRSHFDHLSRINNNRIILLKANESLLCKRLLVASAPAFIPVETFSHDIPIHELPGLSPRAMQFLRANGSRKNSNSSHKRIFLARKNMKWRRLINEEEIAADLRTLGFETIYIEEKTVAEQIDLFQGAQWIVAPNGSALLNVIFADTSTKLLVLSQPNLHNWGTFQGPMEALGYQILFVCGDYALNENAKHSDYQVPVQRIRMALSSLGMSDATT